jgi:quercetin dioxygenase-like cupin family protein
MSVETYPLANIHRRSRLSATADRRVAWRNYVCSVTGAQECASIDQKGKRMSLTEPVLTGPGAGRTVTHGGGSSTELKIAGERSGGAWAVVEWRVRAGDDPPIHTHTREDETIYVLEGSITAYVGDQSIDVEAGSYAALPKDVPHGLTVRGDEARLLVTLEPAGAEYFLVPRDEADADPARFGLVINESAPTA